MFQGLPRRFKAIALSIGVGILVVSARTPAFSQQQYLDAAKQLYAQQKYAQALKYLDVCMAKPHPNATVYYYRALTLQQLHQTTEAMQMYLGIVQNFPHTPEAHLAASALSTSLTASSSSSPSQQHSHSVDTSALAAAFGASPRVINANASDSELSSLPDETRVPFTRGPGGHLIVQAFVNNHPMQVMFDTGASTCVFGKNQFEASGVNAQMTNMHSSLNGVGSKHTATTVGVVDLRVGNLERKMQVTVADELNTPPLLGETFFNGYRYDIDNQGGIIHLMKKASLGGRSSYEPLDTVNVPFQQMGNNIMVNAKVNGHDCPMCFDTGAASICFPASIAAGVGLSIPPDARMVTTSGVGGSAHGYVFDADRIELGPVVKTHVSVVVLVTGGPPVPLLGQPFFHDRRYTIDNETRQIKFMH